MGGKGGVCPKKNRGGIAWKGFVGKACRFNEEGGSDTPMHTMEGCGSWGLMIEWWRSILLLGM